MSGVLLRDTETRGDSLVRGRQTPDGCGHRCRDVTRCPRSWKRQKAPPQSLQLERAQPPSILDFRPQNGKNIISVISHPVGGTLFPPPQELSVRGWGDGVGVGAG